MKNWCPKAFIASAVLRMTVSWEPLLICVLPATPTDQRDAAHLDVPEGQLAEAGLGRLRRVPLVGDRGEPAVVAVVDVQPPARVPLGHEDVLGLLGRGARCGCRWSASRSALRWPAPAARRPGAGRRRRRGASCSCGDCFRRRRCPPGRPPGRYRPGRAPTGTGRPRRTAACVDEAFCTYRTLRGRMAKSRGWHLRPGRAGSWGACRERRRSRREIPRRERFASRQVCPFWLTATGL